MGLSKYLKDKGAIYEFGDYYKSYKDEIIEILEYYRDKSMKVAIWGAGLKGTAFLNVIDSKGKYISYVTDMNKQLYGTMATPRHKVISIDDVLKAAPDVIIIMSAVHYADNYAILKGKGYSGIILDLDAIIENKADPQVIIEGRAYDISIGHNYDLEKIHVHILDILKEIDRICKKHNITYFLSAGTALGAIRHQGFIPWDDDADIGMLREDFERFRKIAVTELNKGYYYQRMGKGSRFYRNFDQIGKYNTAFVLYRLKDLKIHHGLHVDVFPFDFVPEDYKKREELVKEVQRLRTKLSRKLLPHAVTTKNPWKRLIINHERYRLKFIPLRLLHRKMEATLTRYQGKEEQYVADLLTHYKKTMYFKKSDILPVQYVPFEDTSLPVPGNADAYLTMMYGDYMTPPPEGKRNQRHRLILLSYDEAYDKDKKWFGGRSEK